MPSGNCLRTVRHAPSGTFYTSFSSQAYVKRLGRLTQSATCAELLVLLFLVLPVVLLLADKSGGAWASTLAPSEGWQVSLAACLNCDRIEEGKSLSLIKIPPC